MAGNVNTTPAGQVLGLGADSLVQSSRSVNS